MKKILLVGLVLVFFGQISCKDGNNGDNPSPNSSTGVLTDSEKSLLLNKKWYDNIGALNFQFKSNGEFIINDGTIGTWAWRNKGDTMDLMNNGDKWAQIWVSIKSNEAKYRTNQSGLAFQSVYTITTTP